MKKWPLFNGPHRLRNGLLLAALIAITGWLALKPGSYHYSLSDREKEMVTSLLQHPETRYFGFYSVALPAEFIPGHRACEIQFVLPCVLQNVSSGSASYGKVSTHSLSR